MLAPDFLNLTGRFVRKKVQLENRVQALLSSLPRQLLSAGSYIQFFFGLSGKRKVFWFRSSGILWCLGFYSVKELFRIFPEKSKLLLHITKLQPTFEVPLFSLHICQKMDSSEAPQPFLYLKCLKLWTSCFVAKRQLGYFYRAHKLKLETTCSISSLKFTFPQHCGNLTYTVVIKISMNSGPRPFEN